ncbi:MAG: Gfo/Idh/MocA family oxidoreductase [Candidatus Omnitrophota bacterium]|nr:Gfo/Idh/MocA family oxidoreductase [Candidatus Omnitrophota bacterium]
MDGFLTTQRDKQIYRIHKALNLLKRLNRLEVTPEQFDLAKKAIAELDTKKIADFLFETTQTPVILSNLWEDQLRDAMRFYEAAEDRDALLEHAIEGYAGASSSEVAVLVFGGFHKHRIKNILAKKNYSFLVVSPKISEISRVHTDYYKHLMRGGYHSFEVPIFVAKAAPAERVLEMFNGNATFGFLNYLARSDVRRDPQIFEYLLEARSELRSQNDLEAAAAGRRINGQEIQRIGLIGVGRQGQRHLRHIVDQGMNVVAADEYMRDNVFELYGDKESVALEKAEADRVLKDPSIQAVIIATPGKTHYEVVRRALLAGKHVLVEKPFTRDTDQARELVALAEERGLIIMVGHNRYYLPHLLRLKDVVASGKLGKILSVEGNYLNPPQKNDLTHTALEGLGYHQMYMIEAVLGADQPDEVLHAAAGSEDWETFGMALRYGDVPVTVRLDRNYEKKKTRNIIVRGSEFTAIFDYSTEPDFTDLRFEPTISDYIDEPVEYDEKLLQELRQLSALDEEEIKPSLHHQLLAFREAVRTGVDPPSNGRSAINIVETLEDIRHKVEGTGVDLYLSNSLVAVEDFAAVAKSIHEELGVRGGIVSVDGSAGVGKSTFSETLASVFQILYPSRRVVTISLDELLLAWEKRLVIKKMVLGETLTLAEHDTAVTQGWTNLREGQFYESEGILWDSHRIERMLQELTVFFNREYPEDEAATIIKNDNAYIKVEGKRTVKPTRREIFPGDVVIVEGKFANDVSFQRLTDIHLRLEDNAEEIRERYRQERSLFVEAGEEMDKLMHYYDKFCWPSWAAYEKRTEEYIDHELVVTGRSELRSSGSAADGDLSLEELMEGTDTINFQDDIWLPPADLVYDTNIRHAVENLTGKYGVSISLDTWSYGLQEIQRQEIEALVKTAEEDERVKLFVNDTRASRDDPKLEGQYERLKSLPNVQFVPGNNIFNREGRQVIAVDKLDKEGLPSEWHARLTKEWANKDFFYPVTIDEIDERAGKIVAALLLLDSGKKGILRQQALFDQFVNINRTAVIEQLILTYEYSATSA